MEAGNANSKAKLPMTNRERQDFAWRLVLGTFSKKAVKAAAAVSDSQVAIMRRVMKVLGAGAYQSRSWWHAQRDAKGIAGHRPTEEDEEQWLEALAQDYAERLSKGFGTKLLNNPEVAARAFSIHFGRCLPQLARAIREHVSDVEWEEEDSDF